MNQGLDPLGDRSPVPRGGPRGGARLRRVRFPAVGLAVLGTLLGPAPATANTTGRADVVAFPRITVVSDGHQYTGVSAIGYVWEGRVTLDAGASGRIKHWRIWPTLTVQGQARLDLKGAAAFAAWYPSASDPWPRPKHVKKNVARLFPDVAVKDYVVAACNQNADKLRQAGRPDADIFASPYIIPATAAVESEVDVTIGDVSIEAQGPFPVEIACAKWAGALPPKAGDFTSGMEIRQAKLVVFPGEHGGACPVQLTLFGNVRGTTFGSFDSWVESTEGWRSVKKTRTIDSKTNGQAQEEFVEKLVVPIVLPPSKPGGGPASEQALGGLAGSKPGPIDPIPGSPKPPVGPATGVTTGKPGNLHQASLRVVAQARGKTVASPWQLYRVACDPKVAPGLVPLDPLGATGG